MSACPLVLMIEISVQSALHKAMRSDGEHIARLAAIGYLRGAAGFLAHIDGSRFAYEAVQRLADELAAESIKAKG